MLAKGDDIDMSSQELFNRAPPGQTAKILGLAGATLAVGLLLVLAAAMPMYILLLYGLVTLGLLGLAGLVRPDLFLLLLTAVMAIRPEEYLDAIGGVEGSSWYKLAYVGILVAYALRFGTQRTVNWPVWALVAIAFYSFVNPNPYPTLTKFQIVKSLFGLAAGFAVFSLYYRTHDLHRLIWAIALIPLISIVGGLVEQLAGLGRMLEFDPISNVQRLQAGSIPAYLASLCLTGFIAAVNEAILDKRRVFWVLAALNLAVMLATLGRMPLALAMMYSLSMLLFLPFSALGVGRRLVLVIGGSLCVGLFAIIFADALITRFLGGGAPGNEGEALNFMGRLVYWELGAEVLEPSPIIGRGLGTGIIFMLDAKIPGNIRAPHNEYLRLLVDGGFIGLTLFLAGFVALLRGQTRGKPKPIRVMAWTGALVLAVFSLTDNAISAPTALTFLLYLALLLQRGEGPSLPRAPR